MSLSRVAVIRTKIETDQVTKHADKCLRRVLTTTVTAPPVKEGVISLEEEIEVYQSRKKIKILQVL